jgi:hypothetical protein
MSRSEHIVWKSGIDERELLRLDRSTGAISIPVCNINLPQLLELKTAAGECADIVTMLKVVPGQKGAAS